ncbi:MULTISPECIES: hypothetical protein [Streptomyces]|uniref:Uncharacterized protein n=1 Tax=Streptomyces griseoviridis TaxID=45398 RepID=A0ABT9LEV7_STRGD|nr:MULTISPECIES: hypothetical protein [Streptomyces]MDP9682253.1 hypothetical protein [Streptomyces griseoviridis]
MTLEVCRIDPRTGERTQVREKCEVTPDAVPELSSRMPPCACPRCRRR